MLVDGTAAARELGFELPEHHRNLVVLENTPTVHNVIVCTLVTKHGFEHRRLAYLIVEQELERQRSLPQSKAGPRNQLETHGLLGSEEAVDFRAAGHADDALTEFREAGLARDVPPPESRPTSWVG